MTEIAIGIIVISVILFIGLLARLIFWIIKKFMYTMNKRLKFNLMSIVIYAVIICILLIPFEFSCLNKISTSLIIGFFFGFLNDIIIQLRKLNGEKFPNLED